MARESAPVSAAAGAAVLRARAGAAQVEVSGDFAIGVREMGVVEGGCDGNGITEAVMDVAGPEARCFLGLFSRQIACRNFVVAVGK